MFSIKTQNMLEFRPLLCDSKMYVLDGQHRLEAAKQLGLEVFYQINDEGTHEDIVLLNTAQRRWNAIDYVDYHISRGNQDLKKLKEYAENRHITVSNAISLLKGGNELLRDSIRNGNFKFPDAEKMTQLDDLLNKYAQIVSLLKRLESPIPNMLMGINADRPF